MHGLVKVKALEPCDPGWEQSEGSELKSLLASPLVAPACQLGWQQSLAKEGVVMHFPLFFWPQ